MAHKLLGQLFHRVETDKHESDFTYFFSLLLAAEAILKASALGMLAAVEQDTGGNRYRVSYRLVRANGLGEWSDAIEDILSGPASQFLSLTAKEDRNEITRLTSPGDWQYEAIQSLKNALDCLSIDYDRVPGRPNLLRWFKLFTTLRNKTRAHGATRASDAAQASHHLFESLTTICDNLALFRRSWVYLHKNTSGKYRVTPITDHSDGFDFLKSDPSFTYPNGTYIYYDSPKIVPLMVSDPDASDFFLPNGGFTDKSFDLLSYATDNRQTSDSSLYLLPPDLHKSETQGHGELVDKGTCFSNAPDPASDYIKRPDLEQELFDLLMDDRHPVITLQGSGGVGKTSSTLEVIDLLTKEDRYELIVWFSARDIDLLASGPKTVNPGIKSSDDVALQYSHLVLSEQEYTTRGFDSKAFFQGQLEKSDGGPCLFVFDNFETVRNPIEMFKWLESLIRLPNKVLVTTRLRDFKGDYPIEVYGMNEQQARDLIRQVASHLNIQYLLTESNIKELILQSNGHPYIIKILLGQFADIGAFRSPRHIVASSGEILTALFERTFDALSPCGQRAFMTLSAWHSAVPRIALEAILIQSTQERSEVEKGIESLLHYSLAEQKIVGDDRQEFISLPMAAHAFGKKQLSIHVMRPAIESDVQILRMFNPSSISDVNLSLHKGMASFIRNLSTRIDSGETLSDYEPLLNMICRSYNSGWLQLAQWHLERGSDLDLDAAISNIKSFLQSEPASADSAHAWRILADIYSRKQNVFEQIHAFIERAQLDAVPFYDVSNTASLLNRRYNELDVSDARLQLVDRLLSVMERRISEANSDDLSRMAWLALHVSSEERAHQFVERGLLLDPRNIHCQNIASRLGMALPC